MRAICLALVAALPPCAFAQTRVADNDKFVESTSYDDGSTSRGQTGAALPDKPPIGAISFGYIYLASETAPGAAWNFHLHGFYGIAQYNIKPWLALFTDFTQSYNTGRGAHQNVQARLGGFLFTAKSKAKVSPFAFADAGVVRDSNAGTVVTSPAFAVGGGAVVKMNRRLGVLIVPGEYVRTYAPSGQLNNFTGRVGLVLPLR